MRRLALLLVALSATPARAADAGDTRRFGPSPVLSPYLTLDGSHTHGHHGLALGLRSAYEARPLIFYKDGERTADILAERWVLDAAAAYGVLPWLDVGLAVPLVLDQDGRQTAVDRPLSRFAIADPSLALKAELIDATEEGLGLAIIGGASAPLGDGPALAGEAGPTGWARLALEVPVGSRVDLALNAGYRARPAAHIDQIDLDDELDFGLGGSVRVTPDLSGVLETHVATRAGGPFTAVEETPMDADTGVRYRLYGDLEALAGVGAGLSPGYGAPAWRAFVGLELTPRRHDFDGDRVADLADRCLTVPGLRENAGCPPAPMVAAAPPADPDGDGLVGAADRCPNLAEDPDRFLDEDGCPDEDDDQDAVADAVDRAPLEPEDWDQWLDADGVPDLDDDGDGVADAQDPCPREAGGPDGCPGSLAMPRGPDDPLVLGDTIHPHAPLAFDPSGPRLLPAATPVLDALARFLTAHPEMMRVEVGVHVDGNGDQRWKVQLSQQRAEVVVAALVARGVAPERLTARGYGAAVPVAGDETAEGRARNRRVELRVLATGTPHAEAVSRGGAR